MVTDYYDFQLFFSFTFSLDMEALGYQKFGSALHSFMEVFKLLSLYGHKKEETNMIWLLTTQLTIQLAKSIRIEIFQRHFALFMVLAQYVHRS